MITTSRRNAGLLAARGAPPSPHTHLFEALFSYHSERADQLDVPLATEPCNASHSMQCLTFHAPRLPSPISQHLSEIRLVESCAVLPVPRCTAFVQIYADKDRPPLNTTRSPNQVLLGAALLPVIAHTLLEPIKPRLPLVLHLLRADRSLRPFLSGR